MAFNIHGSNVANFIAGWCENLLETGDIESWEAVRQISKLKKRRQRRHLLLLHRLLLNLWILDLLLFSFCFEIFLLCSFP